MDVSLAAGLPSCAFPSCNAFWRLVGSQLRHVLVDCRARPPNIRDLNPLDYCV